MHIREIKKGDNNKQPVLKRFKARARGMGARIIKPTSHIFVEVTKEQ